MSAFWRFIRLFLGVCAVLTFLSAPRSAVSQTKRLTVDEAVELALSDSPQARVAQLRGQLLGAENLSQLATAEREVARYDLLIAIATLNHAAGLPEGSL